MGNYNVLNAIAHTRRRKLGNNTYLEIEKDVVDGQDIYCVRLHATRIVYLYADGSITLNSGGWQTPTTKSRMKDYISGFSLYSHRGAWLCIRRLSRAAMLIPDADLGIKRIYPGYKRKLIPMDVDIVEFTNGLTFHPDRGFTVRPSYTWHSKKPEAF